MAGNARPSADSQTNALVHVPRASAWHTRRTWVPRMQVEPIDAWPTIIVLLIHVFFLNLESLRERCCGNVLFYFSLAGGMGQVYTVWMKTEYFNSWLIASVIIALGLFSGRFHVVVLRAATQNYSQKSGQFTLPNTAVLALLNTFMPDLIWTLFRYTGF